MSIYKAVLSHLFSTFVAGMNQNADALETHLSDYASMQFGSIPYTTTQDVIYYVDEVNGDDGNDGLTSGTAFKTWAKVNSMIPMFVLHNIEVRVIGNISGVYLNGRVIGGFLKIIGDTEDNINHVMTFEGNRPFYGIVGGSTGAAGSSFRLEAFTINMDFIVYGCQAFCMFSIKLQQLSFQNTTAYTVFCEYSGDGDGLIAIYQSLITSFNASGTVDGYGLKASHGSIIAKRGTQPTGNTANEFTEYGGVIR